jgi:hypothetical protein
MCYQICSALTGTTDAETLRAVKIAIDEGVTRIPQW